MPKARKTAAKTDAIEESLLEAIWTLPPEATLGSDVRAKGFMQKLRLAIPLAARKGLQLDGLDIELKVPVSAAPAFAKAKTVIDGKIDGLPALEVIPREVEDILSITTSQRHRWTNDGRLRSAGTRTVKLRGRSRKVTFHVFDPKHIKEVMEDGLVDEWRERDEITKIENRKEAARKAAFTRARKNAAEVAETAPSLDESGERPKLKGWEEFEREGFLR